MLVALKLCSLVGVLRCVGVAGDMMNAVDRVSWSSECYEPWAVVGGVELGNVGAFVHDDGG